jgi:hypothetical protein
MRRTIKNELSANQITNIHDSFVFTVGLDGGLNGG